MCTILTALALSAAGCVHEVRKESSKRSADRAMCTTEATEPGTFGLTVKDGTVSLNAREARLSNVLESVGESAGITVNLKGEIPGKVSTQFKDVPVRAAFQRLAGNHKLEFETVYGSIDDVMVRVTVGEEAESGKEAAAAPGEAKWKTYKSPGWSFACEYPEAWEVKTVVTNPGSPDNVIKEKIEFRGPNGALFWLDIWTNSGNLGLTEWFTKYLREVMGDSAILPKRPNAEIGGEPALVAINRQTMACKEIIAVFKRGDLVFNVTYRCSDKLDAKKIYDHFLESFSFEGKGNG